MRKKKSITTIITLVESEMHNSTTQRFPSSPNQCRRPRSVLHKRRGVSGEEKKTSRFLKQECSTVPRCAALRSTG